MKAQSPFLPDTRTLDALFSCAGVAPVDGAVARGSATRPTAPAAIRFPVAKVPAKGQARASAPPAPEAPALGSTPQIAAPPAATPARDAVEISDDDALRQIFRGERGASLSLEQRLEAFVDWMLHQVGARASFVADADGLILANRNVPETYVIATVSLSHAEQGLLNYLPRPNEGTTTMELDDSNVLHVIRVETTVGRLIVGLIVASPLNRARCAQIRRLLRVGVEWEAVRQ